MINIITSFYTSKLNATYDEERNNELKMCLKNNLCNENIKKIHLYIDDVDALNYVQKLNSDKIIIIEYGKEKPLYSDLFGYAIHNLQNELCMITNSDIYLGDCDIDILKKIENNTVYALTRHEYDLTFPLIENYQGSHDSFIFKSPINDTFLKNVQHVQCVWGSENVLLYELFKSNLKIFNPCKQIKIIHLHKSELRDTNRIRINLERSHIVKPCIL